jgi:hypothetical protein
MLSILLLTFDFFQNKKFKYGEKLDDIELWDPHFELI